MLYTLKQARLLSGKTQVEMAKMLGVCRDTYRKLELHPGVATIEQAKAISKITSIPFDQIFFDS